MEAIAMAQALGGLRGVCAHFSHRHSNHVVSCASFPSPPLGNPELGKQEVQNERSFCLGEDAAADEDTIVKAENDEQRVDETRSVEKVEERLRRSDVVAKQVITVSDAFDIGYVSQLWVDTRERPVQWTVKALELKPSLLFGEVEGVFISNLLKVGDVVLLKDEVSLEGDLHLPSYESIVGVDMVTEDGKYLGKVRDYVFNLRGGEIGYFEFDALGTPLVPAAMISTFGLLIHDVVGLSADRLMVKSGSENRVRRLTTGLLHLPREKNERGRQRKKRSSYIVRDGRRLAGAYRSSFAGKEVRRESDILMQYNPSELDEQ